MSSLFHSNPFDSASLSFPFAFSPTIFSAFAFSLCNAQAFDVKYAYFRFLSQLSLGVAPADPSEADEENSFDGQ